MKDDVSLYDSCPDVERLGRRLDQIENRMLHIVIDIRGDFSAILNHERCEPLEVFIVAICNANCRRYTVHDEGLRTDLRSSQKSFGDDSAAR